MSELHTDEERIEQLRDWWKENGRSVIAGVILGVGGLIGWNAWGDYTQSRAEKASAVYASLQEAAKKEAMQDVQTQLAQLQKDYDATPYAGLGSLQAAKLSAQNADLGAAETALRWAYEHATQAGVRDIAGLRLARVLIALGKLDEAQQIADTKFPAAFDSLVDELKGDIYRARGETDKARVAYDRALSTADDGAEYLRLKREALGEAKVTDEAS